jgi:hypothetical protein
MSDITEIKRTLENRALEVAEHPPPRGILNGKDGACSTAGDPAVVEGRVRGQKAGQG